MAKREQPRDLIGHLRHLRPHLATSAGANARLTLAGLLCGFAFAGLVLYFGTDAGDVTRVVAASLLASAFVMLLYAAVSTTYLAEIADRRWELLTRILYEAETIVPLLLGLTFLLASVCVMGFAWSCTLGWVVTPLSALFVARYAWVSVRDARIGPLARGTDLLIRTSDLLEEILDAAGVTPIGKLRRLSAALAEAIASPGEEAASKLREVLRAIEGETNQGAQERSPAGSGEGS